MSNKVDMFTNTPYNTLPSIRRYAVNGFAEKQQQNKPNLNIYTNTIIRIKRSSDFVFFFFDVIEYFRYRLNLDRRVRFQCKIHSFKLFLHSVHICLFFFFRIIRTKIVIISVYKFRSTL